MKRILQILLIVVLITGNFTSVLAENWVGETETQPEEIIVNKTSTGYKESGNWYDSAIKEADGSGGRYAREESGADYCKWRPSLPAGKYTVLVYKACDPQYSKEHKFDIFFSDGTDIKVIDYSEGKTEWVELGTYLFDEGTDGYVKLSGSKGGGLIRAGAIKFVRNDSASVSKGGANTSASDISIDFLSKLGIFKSTDINVKPEEYIKRSDFAEIIASCLGLESAASPVDTAFTDVNADSQFSGYIASVVGMGIMEGYDDGTFRPDEKVTYNYAVKVLINALGYGLSAENAGGYPYGWLTTATSLGLLKNTQQSGEEPVNWETAAKLIKNALEVDVMAKTVFGDAVKYEVCKGKTLLTEYLNIEKIEGLVTADYYTTLAGDSNLQRNQIEIDKEILKTGATNTALLLGKYVTAYVKNEDDSGDDKTILAIEEKEGKNKTIIIDADDILPKTTVYNLFYSKKEDSKEYNANLSSAAILIYNGKAKINWTAADLMPVSGEVTLLDSQNSGTYDIIFTNDYKNLIVDYIDSEENKVYFKNETSDEWKSVTIEPNSNAVKISFTNVNGSITSVTDCKEWNILSATRSIDGKVLKVIRSEREIIGIIDEVSDDEVVIDGKTYKIAPSLLNNSGLDQLELDREGVFYLDYKRQIAAVDYDISNKRKYGYLIKAVKKSGIDGAGQFKIFTDEGKAIAFDTAKKVKYNGISTENSLILDSPLIFSNGNTIRQLVYYGLNSEGKINWLETAKVGSTMSTNERLEAFTMDTSLSSPIIRGGNLRVLASRYIVGNNCKIFLVPDDNAPENEKDDESSYRLIDQNYLTIDIAMKSAVDIYDVEKDNFVSAIVTSNPVFPFLKASSPVGIVTNVTSIIDASEDIVTKLYVHTNGKDVVLLPRNNTTTARFDIAITDPLKETEVVNSTSGDPVLKNNISLKNLNKGDIVQYSANTDGRINEIRVLFRAKTPVQYERNGTATSSFTNDNAYASLYYAFGVVDDVLKNVALRFIVPSGIGSTTYYERANIFTSSTSYVSYDTNTHKLKDISVSDIIPGDQVFLYVPIGITKLVVAYK